ncbi:MAG: dUTP diphosphatase [Candidatus Shapirobacteria bacterium]|nr:dUTP diphosphatase [Candidatus Shapirobacteria bacterium]MDD4410769.1 dUTP diphosphatase [Candidatus Shapirobacteria bacterium]
MKLKIKRFDKTLPLPVHKTSGSVAVDLYSRLDVEIKAKEIAYIPMNVAIKIPDAYFIMQVPRSSTHKLGVIAVNSVGIIDRDYCGNDDEYLFPAYNFTDKTISIKKGTRLSQLVLIKCENFEFDEVDKMDEVSRGGFGSTGIK